MNLNTILEEIVAGRAILFTGSGVNGQVKNHNGEVFPDGRKLTELLYRECGIDTPDDPYDLQDASMTYVEMKSAAQLIQKLKVIFNISEAGETVPTLYQMPWQRVYTTNYDEGPVLYGSKVAVTINMPTQRYLDQEDICVYVNGYLGKITEETLLSEFKLTAKSYLSADSINSSNWGEVLKNDMEIATTIVIVGLSLDYDLDIKRIVASPELSRKIVFIEKNEISAVKRRKLERIGNVLDIGVDVFAKKLKEYKEQYTPKNEVSRLLCFEKNELCRARKEASALEVYSLLMTGTISPNLFWKTDNRYKSIVYRSQIGEIIEAIDNGYKIVFLHANLGNGKTFLLETLKRRLHWTGVDVYTYMSALNNQEIKDVNFIAGVQKRNVVIIENYFNHMELIKAFGLYGNSMTTFILTARTMIYDTKMSEACNLLNASADKITAIDVNKLNSNEIAALFRILETNQLWGNFTAKSRHEKYNLLKGRNDGDCQFQNALIEVIHSSHMKEEIEKEVNAIRKQSGDFYLGMVILLMSKVMALELTVSDVNRMLHIQCMSNPVYFENSAVKELVEFNRDGKQEYRIKSSIIAKEILSSLCTDGEILNALRKIADFASHYLEFEKYESILKNIVSFSHVNSFLANKHDSISFTVDYFDSLKELNYYKDNSFFWLQYSIACMKYKEFELAQNYVEVAYSKFVKSRYTVPFQCDNQQARIYLELIKCGKSKDVLSDFGKAHGLAMKPCDSDKDREEIVIRLFKYYADKSFSQQVKDAGGIEDYMVRCGEAYNRVNSFVRNMRNERDRERYTKLAEALLNCSVMND